MTASPEDLRRRTYADWYVWAKRNLSATPEICHAAAQAAVEAAADGGSAQDAARRAAAHRVGPGWANPAPPMVRAYAEWYDWSRSNLALKGDDLHRAAAAALEAQDRGADAAGAAAAAGTAAPAPSAAAAGPLPAPPDAPAPAVPPPAPPATPAPAAIAPPPPSSPTPPIAYPVSAPAWSPAPTQATPGAQTAEQARRYADWFAWAHHNVVADVEGSHRAAAAALAAESARGDGEAAARATTRSGDPMATPASPDTRLHAEWFDFMSRHVGAAGPASHAAATAAVGALALGGGTGAAVIAGRRAAGLYPRPGTEFKKNRWRVALLTVFPLYSFWWLWTLFALSQRERFPRGRSFVWILVPIADYVFAYRILADLRAAEGAYAGASALRPALIVTLLVLQYAANIAQNFNNGWLVLAGFLINWAAAGTAAFLTQTSVNRYLSARYPGAPTQRMSNGEIIAVVVTIAAIGLVVARTVLSP